VTGGGRFDLGASLHCMRLRARACNGPTATRRERRTSMALKLNFTDILAHRDMKTLCVQFEMMTSTAVIVSAA
jgi:hypothetical protein